MDTDYTYVQDAIPRVSWLRPFHYEVNIDEVSATKTMLLAEEIDKDAKPFGTYETKKIKMLI